MSDAESAQWRLLSQTRRKTNLTHLDLVKYQMKASRPALRRCTGIRPTPAFIGLVARSVTNLLVPDHQLCHEGSPATSQSGFVAAKRH